MIASATVRAPGIACRWLVGGVMVLLAIAAESAAHERSVSYSVWDLSGDRTTITFRMTELDATAFPARASRPGLPPGADPVAGYLAERLRLTAAGLPCLAHEPPGRSSASEGWRSYQWSVRCPARADLLLTNDAMFDVLPAHIHFARVRLESGDALERVLTGAEREWRITGDDDRVVATPTAIADYVLLGIEHILSGYDHLAFVLALLLLAGSLRALATLVTGFTVAHSLTLALAVLGFARPDAGAVEALIAFSIALVAVENAWLVGGRGPALPVGVIATLVVLSVLAALGVGRLSVATLGGLALFSVCHFGLLERSSRPEIVRSLIAFCFGLVHGFGFAGVLAEIELPPAALAGALFGFNVGVEVGQLGVVALAWPLLRAIRRFGGDGLHGLVVEAGSAGVCAVGTFWFVLRTFG